MKIDNILRILWIQSFKFQKHFFHELRQGRLTGLNADAKSDVTQTQNASVCFDFIKAALPDNEAVLLKFGDDGVKDTFLLYFI